MDLNVIAYFIYLPIMVFITVGLGYTFFKNGRVFILKQFNGDEEMTDFINRILLVGYYLFNLGYCFYIVGDWVTLKHWPHLLTSLSQTIGTIVIALGIMHFINVTVLFLLGRKKRNQKTKIN